jgi:hypothetical protein
LKIGPGSVVIAYLRDPREKVWGILHSMEPPGFVLQGLPLSSFDDWTRAVLAESALPSIGLSTLFYPLHRLEKILLDESVGGVPSMQDQFLRRVGITVRDHLGRSEPAGE